MFVNTIGEKFKQHSRMLGLCSVTSGPQLEIIEGFNDLATACLEDVQASPLTGLLSRVN